MLQRQWINRENDVNENWLPSVVLCTSPSVCMTENDLSLYGLDNFPQIQSLSGEIAFDCCPDEALVAIVVRENEIILLTELIKKAETVDPLLIFVFIIGSRQFELQTLTSATYAVFSIADDHDVAPVVCNAIIALVDLLDVSRGLIGIDLADIIEIIDGRTESRGSVMPDSGALEIPAWMVTIPNKPLIGSDGVKHVGSIGYSSGTSILTVVEEAWHSVRNKDCKRFFLSFAGSPALGLHDINDAANWLDNQVDSDSIILFGAVIDESIPNEQISVVIISFE